MRRTFLRAALMAGASLTASAMPSGSATAHDFRAGDLQIGHPWTRAVAASASTAAGYMTIRNTGSVADRLVGAETSRVNKVEQHEMTMTDGIMRMRPIPRGIAIPPGQEVRLAPGGLHLMLIGPQGGFTQGARIPLTLVFERAGRVEVELAVEAAGARGSGHDGH
ncbi:copper chaperone PCu(A)C [Roseococcus microcysteis]|uniref:copper chaperone PCu(A)C n=1 Tax=Roseococcus microcysteis TaxID=2771361 RepID=UPI00168B46F4|nr:copper chaperone PCu(A)C [Roseococcus microcysteis]